MEKKPRSRFVVTRCENVTHIYGEFLEWTGYTVPQDKDFDELYLLRDNSDPERGDVLAFAGDIAFVREEELLVAAIAPLDWLDRIEALADSH